MQDKYSKIFALMCAQSKWGTTLLFLALFGHFNLEINCFTNQWSVSVLVLFDTFQRLKFTSCFYFYKFIMHCRLFHIKIKTKRMKSKGFQMTKNNLLINTSKRDNIIFPHLEVISKKVKNFGYKSATFRCNLSRSCTDLLKEG